MAEQSTPKSEWMPEQNALKIELTPEQQEQLQQATGKEATAVNLQLEELEARVTPGIRMEN